MRKWGVILGALAAILAAAWLLFPHAHDAASTDSRTQANDGGNSDRDGARGWSWFGRGPHADAGTQTPAGSLDGVVQDPSGVPVDGAIVLVLHGESSSGSAEPIARTVSAGGGHFHLAPIGAGTWAVTATAPGFAPAFQAGLDLAPAQSRSGLVLTLAAPAFTVRGTVREARGGPIPGAAVRAIRYSQDAGDVFETQADENGAYEIALGPGHFTLAASAAGYTTQRKPTDRGARVDFDLEPAARIAGIVLSRADHQPVPGAHVVAQFAQRGEFGDSADTTADGAGRFAFDSLSPGAYRLAATAGNLVGLSDAAVPVTIAQQVTDVVVEVSPGRRISGRVHDGSGAAIAGAHVELFHFGAATSRPSDTTATDGSFHIEGALPGKYSLRASARGWVDAMDDEIDLSGGDATGIDVMLVRGAVVTGLVRDAGGKPIEGAYVTVSLSERRALFGWGAGTTDRTRADGRYRIEELEAGTVTVEAREETRGRATAPDVTLAAGETKEVDLTLAPAASIEGTVRFPDGSPASGVNVFGWCRAKNRMASAQTEKDGSFTIGAVVAGSWVVAASRGEFPPFGASADDPAIARVEISDVERKTVALVIPAGGLRIAGTVTGPDGAVADAAIRAHRRGLYGDPKTAFSGADGSFAIEDLEAGSWIIEANHAGYAPGLLEDVAAGTSGVKIELRRESSLAGIVTGEDGKPVSDYAVSARPAGHRGSGGSPLTIHDPSGAFTIGGLSAGSYDLVVNVADGRVGTLHDITLGAGESRSGLSIVVSGGVTVTGRFVDAITGAPIANMPFGIFGGGTQNSPTTADETGHFSVSGIPPGQDSMLLAFADLGTVPDQFRFTAPDTGGPFDLGVLRLLKRTRDDAAAGVGLSADWKMGDAVVRSVTPGSAADAAGLARGDHLVTIGGIDAPGLGSMGLEFLLSGAPGSAVSLSFTSASGESKSVTLTRTTAQPSHGWP